MENEIKVNEFIRTKYGEIAKVIEYRDEIVLDKEIKFYGMYRSYICEDELDFIVKHSSNLIDLIQCGDYLNGKEVKHIADFEGIEKPIRKIIFVDETHLIPGETAEDKDIKTVVTKEMMESISYKIKGVNDEN